MANNKVVYGDTVVMDITDTTATPSDVAEGVTFYGNDGVKRTGTAEDEIFIAVYGVTTYEEVQTAIRSGKVVAVATSNGFAKVVGTAIVKSDAIDLYLCYANGYSKNSVNTSNQWSGTSGIFFPVNRLCRQ